MPIEVPEVPTELRALDHWVIWRPLINYPMSPHGGVAKSTDPTTWGTFEQAVAFAQTGDKLALATAHGLVSVDLDGCVKDGEVHPDAQVVVDHLDTYTEISKSGKGLHILGWGKLNSDRHSTSDTPWRELHLNEYGNPDHCDFEVYDSGRLITITGDTLPGHEEVSEIDAVLPDVIAAYLPAPEPRVGGQMRTEGGTLDAHAVLASARACASAAKFTALYDEGDINTWHDGDHSRADMALISMLTFWTDDPDVLYELFCDSALYQPDVAKRGQRYIERSIRKAIENCTEWFGMDDDDEEDEEDAMDDEQEQEDQEDAPKTKGALKVSSLLDARSDLGNSRRFVEDYGSIIRHVSEWKPAWLVWDEKRWKPDRIGKHQQLAATSVRNWEKRVAADDWPRGKERIALFQWLNRSESHGATSAMLNHAKVDHRLAAHGEDFDRDPWSLNVQNGILDLRTGDLRAHDSAEMHSKITRGAYLPGVACPLWDHFIQEILPDDELRRYIQKLAGYTLGGHIGENVFPFTYGEGGNGKSVMLGAFRYAMSDYATQAPDNLLIKSRRDTHPTVIAGLLGFRLVTTLEAEKGEQMDTKVLKELTGEETITSRKLYENNAQYTNMMTIWLAANDKPEVSGIDEAVWRRMRLLPFEFQVDPEKKDSRLGDKLKAEADGILSWMIEGSLIYHEEGLEPLPTKVQEATEEYRSESNPLLAWVEDEGSLGATLDPEAKTYTSVLRDRYDAWAKTVPWRERVKKGKMWGSCLQRLGCTSHPDSKGYTYWQGIRVHD